MITSEEIKTGEVMKKNKRLVPKRRFKEFKNDKGWEQHKLSEVAKYRNGRAHENNISEKGKYIVVNSKFVSTDGKVKKYSDKQIEPLYKNDIAIVLSDVPNGRAIARTFLVERDDKFTLNQRIARISTLEDVYSYFLYILMNRNRYFLQFDDGAKQTNLSVADVMSFESFYPKIEEQTKIGIFFKNLDNLIILQQKKLNKAEALKSAYLFDLFPKEGEEYPKLRFNGFTDDWEQCKVGTLAEFNPITELPETFEYVDLESVVGTEMVYHRKEYKLTAPSRAQRLARQGDLFYQTVRPYQGNNYLFENTDDDYVFSTGYAQMRPYYDGYFLFCLVQNDLFVKDVLDRCTGTSYPAINSNDLADIDAKVPKSMVEQQQISNLFRNLDRLISFNQHKLEKLKSIKKAYLNELFL